MGVELIRETFPYLGKFPLQGHSWVPASEQLLHIYPKQQLEMQTKDYQGDRRGANLISKEGDDTFLIRENGYLWVEEVGVGGWHRPRAEGWSGAHGWAGALVHGSLLLTRSELTQDTRLASS